MLLQRPTEWLWKALGIVRGTNPSYLLTDVVATVDAMQNGLGQAKDEVTLINGSLVGVVNTPFPATTDPDHGLLIRFSVSNPGTANCLVSAQLLDPTSNIGPVLWIGNVTAAFTFAWFSGASGAPGFGGGSQFIFIPPGWRMMLSLGQYTTTAGLAQVHTCRVPAGTRPW